MFWLREREGEDLRGWGKEVWVEMRAWWHQMSREEAWEFCVAVGVPWLLTWGVGMIGWRWTRARLWGKKGGRKDLGSKSLPGKNVMEDSI